MPKTDNAMEAMRYLLMKYDNERKFIYGEINALLNTSSGFSMEDLIFKIGTKVDNVAVLEQKFTILYNLISQATAQLNNDQKPEAPPTEQ